MVFTGKFNLEEIEAEIEDFLFRRGFELVDIRLEPSSTRPLLEVFADKLGGINIQDLSEINSRLKLFLEASEFFPSTFQLVVSSPGLDRVIKKEDDFARFIGRKIRLNWPNSSSRNGAGRQGILLGFENGIIVVEMSDKSVERFDINDLKSVRLVPDIDFNLDSNRNEGKGKV